MSRVMRIFRTCVMVAIGKIVVILTIVAILWRPLDAFFKLFKYSRRLSRKWLIRSPVGEHHIGELLVPPLSQLVRMVTMGLLGIGACTHHSAAPMLADRLPACCQSRYPSVAFLTTSTTQLCAEYKRLKRRKCPAYAHFGSDFHQLLRVLGERLDGQPLPMLQQVLGRPDRVRGDSLIYYWRGEHDYLYFRLTAQQRVHSAWYYAYE